MTSQDEPYISVNNSSFALNGNDVSYQFHVDEESGDLLSDHFGGRVDQTPIRGAPARVNWSTSGALREFPDLGRGDFRVPAVHIRHSSGHTVTHFEYKGYSLEDGKPGLSGLPCTFGTPEEVQTLIVHMHDARNAVSADLSYSIFPRHDAIARSVTITNKGDSELIVEKLASFSLDLPKGPGIGYDLVGLHGEWTRERQRTRAKISTGVQGFGSTQGVSSHLHNPFLAICSNDATETSGPVWGLALVYSGSHASEVELSPRGTIRATMGMNPLQLSWPLAPGESLTSPECVAVYSGSGFGDMSRKLHRLIQHNLMRSKFALQPRPPLLNDWEGVYFNFDETTIYEMAKQSAQIGVKLFVMDDGWFGDKHPRVNEKAGLGDWVPNPSRFPCGLETLVKRIKNDHKLQFGIWVEPEMVSPSSELFEAHPDWVMRASGHHITEMRYQYVLNLSLPEVQDYIIEVMTKLLRTVSIEYVKWDHNRAILESPSPATYHKYMLGAYRVFETLTQGFPDILWEACASGGARFDLGMLHYFPQIWTSDNTDALDRISIQLGTSLAYPASSMGAHISASPNDETRRVTPLDFRAHVAMMGGSFGLELDPRKLSDEDRAAIPSIIELSEEVNPIIIRGDMYRLSLPEESNYPAVLFVSEDGMRAVLFMFQIKMIRLEEYPVIRLQGLEPHARYTVDGEGPYSGRSLMNGGMRPDFKGDFDSKIVILSKV